MSKAIMQKAIEFILSTPIEDKYWQQAIKITCDLNMAIEIEEKEDELKQLISLFGTLEEIKQDLIDVRKLKNRLPDYHAVMDNLEENYPIIVKVMH